MADSGAIVLLHGFTNTGAAWRRVLSAGIQAATPTIRAHSLSEVLDTLDTTTPERFTLGGYSQGGRIALHAALDPRLAPRIERLVLISASPGLRDPEERARRRAADEALAASIESAPLEEFIVAWAHTPVLSGLAPDLAAEAYVDRQNNTAEDLAAGLRGLGTGALPSLWDRLGELSMPVELVAGERDTKFTATAEQMAPLIPDARVHIVPDAGHQVHLEQPATIAVLLAPPERWLAHR